MTPSPVPLRRIAIEWRYQPNIGVYTSMDHFGKRHKEDFPDWERSALTLELRNRASRSRFAMLHNRCFFDFVLGKGPTASAAGSDANRLFEEFARSIEVSQLQRVGIRHWFAFENARSFSELVSRSVRAFQCTELMNPEIVKGHVDDIGLVLDMTAPAGTWKYHLRAGPMVRKQWVDVVDVERKSFQSAADFDSYKASIPDQMLYVDVDCYREGCSLSEMRDWLVEANAFAEDVSTRLDDYFEKV